MTTLPPDFVVVRTRAQPMSPEERRESIIDAVVPLLKEHGRDVSSRQIAEAAGVAEGTIFRAFGDKETLISAAIARFFDPQPFRDALRAIDPDEPTVDKITQVVQLLRDRFHGVIGFMSALGMELASDSGSICIMPISSITHLPVSLARAERFFDAMKKMSRMFGTTG